MSAQWYYMLGDKQLGPVSGSQLKQLAQTGQLQSTDQVWKEGMPSWEPASKIKGLFQVTSSPPPVPKPNIVTESGKQRDDPALPPLPPIHPHDSGKADSIITQGLEIWRGFKRPI